MEIIHKKFFICVRREPRSPSILWDEATVIGAGAKYLGRLILSSSRLAGSGIRSGAPGIQPRVPMDACKPQCQPPFILHKASNIGVIGMC